MTVMAPHESKMFEAMIQSLDPASGTAKVKFAKVSPFFIVRPLGMTIY